MSGERKESKKEELNPFYKVPDVIAGEYTIEIDDFSRYLFLKGDSQKLNLFAGEIEEKEAEVKAFLGQRYVIVGFASKGVIHIRAIPGFEFIQDKEQKERLREKARKYFDHEKFKCTSDDIAFPDHAVWTGVVHEQLISKITAKEPDIVMDSPIIGFSVIKKDGKYFWLNRSARNSATFLPDPLASACYMFETRSDYKEFTPPKFDLFYHLTRAVPEKIFVNLTNVITEDLCKDDILPLTKSSLDICTNFMYEAMWEKIRALYQSDKAKAHEEIQHMLMRNLHVYLSNKSSPDYKDRAEKILIDGLISAANHGIFIDLNYIPPEFAGDETALEKVRSYSSTIGEFLYQYKEIPIEYRYKLLATAAELDDVDTVKKILLNSFGSLKNDSYTRMMLENVIKTNRLDIINILYKACATEQDKDKLNLQICNMLETNLKEGKIDEVEKALKILPKQIIEYIKIDFVSLNMLSGTNLLSFVDILLEAKPDLEKKNSQGDTLLHVAGSKGLAKLVTALIEKNVNPNILDSSRCTAMQRAAFNGHWDTVQTLLKQGADPHPGAHCTVFEYAVRMDTKKETVMWLLTHGVKFPSAFVEEATSEEYIRMLTDIIASYFTEYYELDILDIMCKAIKNQDNTKIQEKLVNMLVNLFLMHSSKFSSFDYTSEVFQKFASLTDLPALPTIEIDQKSIQMVIEKIENAHIAIKCSIINALLDSHSMLGQVLSKASEELQFNFRQKLEEIKRNAECILALDAIGDKIYSLDYESAKQLLKPIPREVILQEIKKDEIQLPNLKPYLYVALILKDEKPDLNQKNEKGDTLLQHFIKKPGVDFLIRGLLKHNADPNIEDADGRSPLSNAVLNSNSDVVKQLLEAKADPNQYKNPDYCPLLCAMKLQREYIINLLVDHSAKLPDEFLIAGHPVEATVESFLQRMCYEIPNIIIYSRRQEMFESITKLICNYDNPAIQAKLTNMAFDILSHFIKTKDPDLVLNFLDFFKIPASISLDTKRQIELLTQLYDNITKVEDKKKQIKIIDTVLDTSNSVGLILLKTDSKSSIFASQTNEIRKNLEELRNKIVNDKKLDKR